MNKTFKIILIIVGVVLAGIVISLVLVNLGVIGTGAALHYEAQNAADKQADAMDSLATSLFNRQFSSYCGNNIKGTLVKSLIATATSSELELDGITTAEEIDSAAFYTVTESYGKDGLINKITITEN